jgi:hypothetical protein
MTGRPKLQAVKDVLDRRMEAEYEGEVTSHLEYIAKRVEAGELCQDIFEELIEQSGMALQPTALNNYLTREYGDQGAARLVEARRIGSYVLAEESIRVIRKAPNDRDAISRATAESKSMTWMAGKVNRPVFGETPQIAIGAVNVGGLHLSALQRAPSTSVSGSSHSVESMITDGDDPTLMLTASVEGQDRG